MIRFIPAIWRVRLIAERDGTFSGDLPRDGFKRPFDRELAARLNYNVRHDVEVDADRQIRAGFSVCTRCGTDILRHVLALRPYDTLFLLSSRQTVTSIASALMWLISLLFQNQAFNRARTLGIHFALIISWSNECLTMP